MNTTPSILVVDDQPVNVKLLQRKLEREGMEVYVAYNGQQCLESVSHHTPDLILLDVMMPEMDGIEVCRRLKANPATRSIPIMFITARTSREGKIEGLTVGAVDYITKPIDLEETLARVKTQLRLQDYFRQNLDLQQRLAETRHAAAVGAITQGIAHNLNNLLGVAMGYLDLLKHSADKPDMVQHSVKFVGQSIQRMVEIVRQLTTITNQEQVTLNEHNLQVLLQNAVNRFLEESALKTEVEIENPFPDLDYNTNAELVEAILGKLLMNGWESYEKGMPAESRRISIEAGLEVGEDDKTFLTVSVLDGGKGVDPEVRENLFDPFISGHHEVGRGMGLTIARHHAKSLGGDIFLMARDDDEPGTCAKLQLPFDQE